MYDGSWITDLKRKPKKRGQIIGETYITNETYLALRGHTDDERSRATMSICEKTPDKAFRRKYQSDVWGEDFKALFPDDPLPKCPHCGAEDSMEPVKTEYQNIETHYSVCVVCDHRSDPE